MHTIVRGLVTLLATMGLLSGHVASAADFPSKPIRIIVPFAPGGSADIVARLIAQEAQTRTGQRVFVENKPGGSTMIGTEAVIHSDPDGYTLLMGTSSLILTALLDQQSSFDVERDLIAVTNVASAPFVWTVNADLPVKTLGEFATYLKAHPERASFATSGVGSSQHLSGELLNMKAGIKMVHVLYKSELQAITDLIGNHVTAVPASYSALAGQLASGRLRPLAVTSRTRMKLLPNIPTVEESGFAGYQIEYWNGFFAAAKTPQNIVDKLSDVLTASIRAPHISAKLEEFGFKVEATPTAAYTRQMGVDTRRWRELIQATGVVIPK